MIFMKTREQIETYLKENGHTSTAIDHIAGFLTGKDIKKYNEKLIFKKGDGSFASFLAWFDSEDTKPQPNDPLYELLCDLFEKVEKSDNHYETERARKHISFLISAFVIDASPRRV